METRKELVLCCFPPCRVLLPPAVRLPAMLLVLRLICTTARVWILHPADFFMWALPLEPQHVPLVLLCYRGASARPSCADRRELLRTVCGKRKTTSSLEHSAYSCTR
ncbi:hypothetical protein cyc_08728 [Cyclospora cayetanensis]|uniref:Uncharacterized protein n=1 Tax=Cyclospora cayetanensis TaxID=88456 RepID=A0A1D3D1T3_9EIME|nr:hypothetical protein cyc_08728 [Cyclospora cayetanensis]